MGYTTHFRGAFVFDKALTKGQQKELEDVVSQENVEFRGESLRYCQWIPNEEGTALEWDYGEKFYQYIEWLEYLVEAFFKPEGVKLNGTVQWQGEETGDVGKIVVKNNKVKIVEPKWEE